MVETKTIKDSVRQFYDLLPFNYASGIEEQTQIIQKKNQIEIYAPLSNHLRNARPKTLLDVGCGAGWFSNTVAYHYNIPVWGIDFTERAVERAVATAKKAGISGKTTFVCADLFKMDDVFKGKRFDVVNSLGVLHHTEDCRKAFEKTAAMVADGGYLHVGLYHKYGRQPLLDLFEPMRSSLERAKDPAEKESIMEEGFTVWRGLFQKTTDEVFQRSWFRDQCLHPHETQWTLKEVLGWIAEAGFEPLSTSLNHFKEPVNWEDVTRQEVEQKNIALERLSQKTYFPGFFVVWAKKKAKH